MKIRNLLLTVICATTIGGASQEAYSSTQAAMAGHGWPDHFDTCFGSSWAMMVNNCAGTVGSTRALIIPVQVNTSSSATYTAFVRAGGNGNDGFTTCQAIATTSTGGGYDFSQRVSTTTSSATQSLNLGSVSTSAGGVLHFECTVAEGGGRVINVEFK